VETVLEGEAIYVTMSAHGNLSEVIQRGSKGEFSRPEEGFSKELFPSGSGGQQNKQACWNAENIARCMYAFPAVKEFPYEDRSASTAMCQDGGFVVAMVHNHRLSITRYDAEGNPTWIRTPDEGVIVREIVIKTCFGGFLLAGSCGAGFSWEDSAKEHYPENPKVKDAMPFLAKLDEEGRPVWFQLVHGHYSRPLSACETRNGEIVISVAQSTGAIMARYTADGKQLWVRETRGYYNFIGPLPNGSMVALSSSFGGVYKSKEGTLNYPYDDAGLFSKSKYYVYLECLDDSGVPIWIRSVRIWARGAFGEYTSSRFTSCMNSGGETICSGAFDGPIAFQKDALAKDWAYLEFPNIKNGVYFVRYSPQGQLLSYGILADNVSLKYDIKLISAPNGETVCGVVFGRQMSFFDSNGEHTLEGRLLSRQYGLAAFSFGIPGTEYGIKVEQTPDDGA